MKRINEGYFQAEYEESLNTITFRWLKSPTSQEYRSALKLLLAMIKANSADNVIFDTMGLGAISEEDEAWYMKEWLPQAVAVGQKKNALIMPPDIFAQMAVNDMMKKLWGKEAAPSNMNKYFDNEDKARAWVASQKKTTAS
uniref:STAS/SEC14 domain-containing protein n=1 Tax=Roseihalotalea indica TaxID=2867963 RepID=A0AA49GUX7_9BACT|nr:hypothetical protein K4G66_13020 [Tunicatimonas sp. TK19036]